MEVTLMHSLYALEQGKDVYYYCYILIQDRKNQPILKKKKNTCKDWKRDFSCGPVVENPPSNAGDAGLTPGRGNKIPHATGQLSPRATTTELRCLNQKACVPQTTEPMHSGTCVPQLQSPNALEPACHNQREKTHMPQLERSPRAATKDPA